MVPINNIISEKLIHALGWVIIHSIWQGILITGLVALLFFVYRRRTPRVRYWIGMAALVLMAVMSVVTFLSVYQAPYQDRTLPAGFDLKGSSHSVVKPAVLSDESENSSPPGIWKPIGIFKNSIDKHLPLVVTIWFIGVMLLMVKSAGGLVMNLRLKKEGLKKLPKIWQDKLNDLCFKAGVHRPVFLAESARVKSPMTLGWLKPVILVPLGLIMQMPQDEVEAVLAHELAHIARKDYLLNILQLFIEVLFFYHPAIRWISTSVRSERENCCDDFAVFITGDSLNVARALSNIASKNRENPILAQAAAGSNWRLFKRIKRLVGPPKMDYQMGGSAIVIFFLGISFLAVMLSANVTRNFGLEMKQSNPVVEEKKISTGSQGDHEDQMEIKKSKHRNMLQRFMVNDDTYIKIGGKVKIKKGAMIHCRIVDARTNKQIWKYRVENRVDGIHPFADRLFLKKGTYDLESDQNFQDLFIKDLKLNSENILFSSIPEDEEAASERELEHKKQELIQREKALAEREQKIKQREEALNRLERRRLSDERKILKKEAEERAKIEQERLRMEDKLHDLQRKLEKEERDQKMRGEEISRKKEGELVQDREEMLEKHEREKVKMEESLNRLKDEVRELSEREARISRETLDDLDEEEEKIRDGVDRIGDELEEIEEKIRREEKKIKGEELFLKRLINELMKDKLINDENDFEFRLTQTALFIDGKKQPKNYFLKYKKIIEQHRGKKLERDAKFQIINRK